MSGDSEVVRRYNAPAVFGCMRVAPDGGWITHDDHARIVATLQSDLEAVRKERDEAQECVLIARWELEALKNTPPTNEGMNACGHNRYWIGHYGKCMACMRDNSDRAHHEAATERDQALRDLEAARGLLKQALPFVVPTDHDGRSEEEIRDSYPDSSAAIDRLRDRILTLLTPPRKSDGEVRG